MPSLGTTTANHRVSVNFMCKPIKMGNHGHFTISRKGANLGTPFVPGVAGSKASEKGFLSGRVNHGASIVPGTALLEATTKGFPAGNGNFAVPYSMIAGLGR